MAFSEVYVDPSIAADSGTGTIGDPYGDLEYAIEQTTFDTTNGTRVNIKSGTDEVLAAELDTALADTSVSVAWTPSGTAPCVFQGYTAVAGDGGKGGISGGGSVEIISTTRDFIWFIDLHLHNTGANNVLTLDDNSAVVRCEVDNTTARGIDGDADLHVSQCYIHNCGTDGAYALGGFFFENYIENGAGTMSTALSHGGSQPLAIIGNIIAVDSATDGISAGNRSSISNNSIYSNGGTGQGIRGTTGKTAKCTGNLIEGFSGAGGVGIDFPADSHINYYGSNAVYDCTTAYNDPENTGIDAGDNETLTASPFTDAANGDFSPVDTGNVKEGSLPNVTGGGFV